MGKKKSTQQHQQQSFGNMVSRAALAQMGPQLEQLVRHFVSELGNQLAVQHASTLETLFARVVAIESILMDELDYTTEDLTKKVAQIQDEKENLEEVETAELGDTVRLEISTKTSDQQEYQGSSRLKISKIGTGQTIGEELESAVLGMKAGETKETSFGKDKAMIAKIKIDRVSRTLKIQVTEPSSQGETNDNQTQG